MPEEEAATSLAEDLHVQYVYLKLSLSAVTIRGGFKGLENHQFKNHPESELEKKRRICSDLAPEQREGE